MKKKIIIIALVASLVASLVGNISLYLAWQGEIVSQRYDKAVPDIELIAAMGFYGVDVQYGKVVTSSNPGNIAFGKITGFVTFPNVDDQPRGARQYYTIEAVEFYDESGSQLFTLDETMKLNAIPPRAFDAEVLSVTSNTDQVLTLETESGQIFRINKRTDEVTIIDGGDDISTLITNQSDYRDFIVNFLK